MNLELEVRNALANDAAVGAATLDASGSIRIYPIVLKQETAFPAITYNRTGVVRTGKTGSYAHNGLPSGYTGAGWARLSLTVWSDEFDDVVTLGDSVIKVLHRLALGNFLRPATQILLDQTTQEPERNLYMRVIDAQVWFQEAT